MNQKISMQLRTKRLATSAVFLTVTLIIGIIERSIPFDAAIPGVKLGLANVVVLTMLYIFKPSDVFVIVILKCILISIFTGSPTALFYSISGSVLSFTSMTLLIKLSKNMLSIVGISVVGAIFHNIGQIAAASFVLGSNKIVLYLPVLLVSAVITGVIVGMGAKALVSRLRYLKI